MVDTFSNMIVASAHKGETTSVSIHHLLYTFSFLGRPLQLNADDGPAYGSKRFKEFCNLGTISHITWSHTTQRIKLLWNDTIKFLNVNFKNIYSI